MVVRIPHRFSPLFHNLGHQLFVLSPLAFVIEPWLFVDPAESHIPVIKLGEDLRSSHLDVLQLRVFLPKLGESVPGFIVVGPYSLQLGFLSVFSNDSVRVILIDAFRVLLELPLVLKLCSGNQSMLLHVPDLEHVQRPIGL